jgi:hypothetical protein
MAFIVIYDANALYPNTLRDLLIRIAQQPHLVQAKWTNEILDEMLRALKRNRSDITEEKAAGLRELINESVRDCQVTGYRPLIDALELPDPADRHVLAAAISEIRQKCVPPGAPLAGSRSLRSEPWQCGMMTFPSARRRTTAPSRWRRAAGRRGTTNSRSR